MQKTYHELRIAPSNHYDLFLDLIFTLSDEAVEEDGKSIILRSEESLELVRFGIESLAQNLETMYNQKIELNIEQSVKENEDWISKYRNSVQPLHVGNFYVHPSWLEDDLTKQNIIIDPALAFGSGHHETTFGCLMLLQKYIQKNNTVLDVGCGSGILGLAARKLEALVDLCDTDEQAVQSTQENFILNHETYRRIWTGSVQLREEMYDVVIANIIADVLIMLSSDLKKAVKEDGILILSGILDKYVDKVEAKIASMTLLEKYQKEEWFTLVLQRKMK